MGESLIERRRVQDETLRSVNCFSTRKSLCSTSGYCCNGYEIRKNTKIRNYLFVYSYKIRIS